MIYSLKKENKFKKGVFVIGDLVWGIEYTKGGGKIRRLYEIINVVDKNTYNMYIGRSIKLNTRVTITDQDYFCGNVCNLFEELEVD